MEVYAGTLPDVSKHARERAEVVTPVAKIGIGGVAHIVWNFNTGLGRMTRRRNLRRRLACTPKQTSLQLCQDSRSNRELRVATRE
jgi:hypothetical protein